MDSKICSASSNSWAVVLNERSVAIPEMLGGAGWEAGRLRRTHLRSGDSADIRAYSVAIFNRGVGAIREFIQP